MISFPCHPLASRLASEKCFSTKRWLTDELVRGERGKKCFLYIDEIFFFSFSLHRLSPKKKLWSFKCPGWQSLMAVAAGGGESCGRKLKFITFLHRRAGCRSHFLSWGSVAGVLDSVDKEGRKSVVLADCPSRSTLLRHCPKHKTFTWYHLARTS